MAGLICWNCGRPTGKEGKVMRADSCVECLADLRCCRGCRFFDPNAFRQCKETINSPVTMKEKSNFCDWFQVRNAIHSHKGKPNKHDSKEVKQEKFDDLFDD